MAARTNHLAEHLEQWETLSVEPEVVGCVPASLALFSRFFTPAEGVHFQLHLGLSETTCILVHKGKLLAAQASRLSINTLIDAYAKDMNLERANAEEVFYKIDFSSERETASPELFKAINALRLELTKFLYAFAKHASGTEVPEILVTGEGSILPNFSEMLCSYLKKTLLSPKEVPVFRTYRSLSKTPYP